MRRLLLGLLFTGCAAMAPRTTFTERDISLSWPRDAFTDAKVEAMPKHLESPNELPFAARPRGWVIVLSHAPRTTMKLVEPRYYYPSSSRIFVTPLTDASVPDYAAAYPRWASAATRLRALLDAPGASGVEDGLPSEPFNNAARVLEAKVRRIESPALSGYRMLCYYRQGRSGYGATNAELTYEFQGLTRDGRYYVSARLAVRNDRLPDSIDDPRADSGETVEEQVAEKQRANSWSDGSFFPSLRALDEMMLSIRIR